MMRRASIALLTVVMLAAGVSSCGKPSKKESKANVQEMRTQVVDNIGEVREVLATAGLAPSRARGRYLACGAPPNPGYEYHAGMDLAAVEDVAADITQISDLLQESGWKIESEGTDPEPYANLSREPVRVNLVESRRDPGVIGVSLAHDCVAAPTDMAGDLLGKPEEL